MFNNSNSHKFYDILKFKAKALAAGVTETEYRVIEATNDDKWGPPGSTLQEIAREASNHEKYPQIISMLWQRLAEHGENWRRCYKALLVCEYLVKHGPMRCVEEFQLSVGAFERLRDQFQYKDLDGRDQGVNVRHRAGELAVLLNRNDRIKEEREKARLTAGKYTGMSGADIMAGKGGFGSGGSRYAGYGNGSAGYGSSAGGSYDSHGHDSISKDYTGLGDSGGSRAGASGSRPKSAMSALDEDPFEATRRRIEKLKASGSIEEEFGSKEGASELPADSVVAGSIDMDASANLFPEMKTRLGPKKLSEVKVNPAIAAAFGAVTPASSSGSLHALPPPGAKLVHDTSASSSGMDLLGQLEAPPPVAPSVTQSGQPSIANSTAATAAAAIDWDALASAPAPAATPAADLLTDVGTPAPAAAASDLFNALSEAPESDPFAEIVSAPVPTAPVMNAAAAPPTIDPFALFDSHQATATPLAKAADPFARASAVFDSHQAPAAAFVMAADPFARASAPPGPAASYMAPPKPAFGVNTHGHAPMVPSAAATTARKPIDPFADLLK